MSVMHFETKYEAEAATIPVDVRAIQTAGYYAAGDYGGAWYRRATTEPAHAGKLQSANKVWWEISEDVINVHMLGARWDGVTEDTRAIIDADEVARLGKGILVFMHRTYLIDGITLGGGDHKSCTWIGNGYDPRGNEHLSATLKLKDRADKSMIYIDAGGGQYIFERLIFNGNRSNQRSASYCVQLANVDPVAPGTYLYGAHFRRCHFLYGRDGGLYVGRNRGWGSLEQCAIQYNGVGPDDHGLVIDSYDWNLNIVHIGPNTGFGIVLGHASQVQMAQVNVFLNDAGGIYVSENCTDFVMLGGSIDRNKKHGLYTVRNVNPNYRGGRSVHGVRFLANGTALNFSDVYCADAEDALSIIGCDFMGHEGSGSKPKYFFEFNNVSARIKAVGNHYDTGRPGWGIALTNHRGCIVSSDT